MYQLVRRKKRINCHFSTLLFTVWNQISSSLQSTGNQHIQTNIWISAPITLCNTSTVLQKHSSIVLRVLCLILMISRRKSRTSQLLCDTVDIHPGLLQLQPPHLLLLLKGNLAVKQPPPVKRNLLYSPTTVGFPRCFKELSKSMVFTFATSHIAPSANVW